MKGAWVFASRAFEDRPSTVARPDGIEETHVRGVIRIISALFRHDVGSVQRETSNGVHS